MEKPDFVKIAEALTEAKVMGSAILHLENVTVTLIIKDHRHPDDTPASPS